MSSLMDKLKKNSKIKETMTLEKSVVFEAKDFITTEYPMINLALSGEIDGGLTSGLTMIAGPSKHFKTSYALIMASAFLKKNKDGVILFYDSEYGSPQAYFEQFGVDTARVVHTPIMNVEELKFDLIAQLDGIEKKDKVMILIDSVGNLASKKEIDDAQNEKSVADMTRAKQMKSLWRMATPYFKKFDIPCVAINHTYQTQEMFSKAVVSGGTGGIYSSDTIFIIGKSQEKTGKEITGYNFTINIEKSRFVKEKSKFQVRANWEGGIVKWHGFIDVALEGGYIEKPTVGYYSRPCIPEDKKVREKVTSTEEWWAPVLEKTDFKEYLKAKYKISYDMPGQDDTDFLDEGAEPNEDDNE